MTGGAPARPQAARQPSHPTTRQAASWPGEHGPPASTRPRPAARPKPLGPRRYRSAPKASGEARPITKKPRVVITGTKAPAVRMMEAEAA